MWEINGNVAGLLVRGGMMGVQLQGHVQSEKRVEEKNRVKIFAYLVCSNSWTLAFTFDTREVNVRLLATKGAEALR